MLRCHSRLWVRRLVRAFIFLQGGWGMKGYSISIPHRRVVHDLKVSLGLCISKEKWSIDST